MKEGKKYAKNEDFVIHPDIRDATKNYNGKDTFKDAFAKRDELLEGGEPFWNTDHDEEMLETARERTDNFSKIKPWPQKRKR